MNGSKVLKLLIVCLICLGVIAGAVALVQWLAT
jgi:hypothetical protein